MRISHSFKQGIGVLKEKITHSYAQGHRCWRAGDVLTALGHVANVHDDEFMDILKDWENRGYIRIVDTHDCLFEVLKIFPRA